MQKKIKIRIYYVEFMYENRFTEFHQLFATSINDARKRAQILKKHLFDGFISLRKVRTIVFRRSF